MNQKTRQVTVGAALVALALALSYMERLIPLGLLIPIPGVKLGLANIVTVLALYILGAATAFFVLVARCLLGCLFGGGISGLLFSLSGGVLAMVIMALVKQIPFFSIYAVSILGAAAHNIGQILVAVGVLQSPTVLAYLPPLLLVGLGTGFLTGTLGAGTLRALSSSGTLHKINYTAGGSPHD